MGKPKRRVKAGREGRHLLDDIILIKFNKEIKCSYREEGEPQGNSLEDIHPAGKSGLLQEKDGNWEGKKAKSQVAETEA